MVDFALIGAGGFVAPRHMNAIKSVGGTLKVALDPNNSVGILDSYFPQTVFFTEFERFDRHIDKLARRNQPVDYISICSPNYLHDAHCRFALRAGANAICEKPLVLNPWNIDGLAEIEQATGKRICTILQVRLHPAVQALKKKIQASKKENFDVELTYITSRGAWYHASWKGDEEKSGGVATNIGVHFFDMLMDIFGTASLNVSHLHDESRAAGFLQCGRANIRWFLSVDANDLPENVKGKKTTYRSIKVDGEEVEFSEGFTDLHIRSYEDIITGRGFGIETVRPSIEVVSAFRSQQPDFRRGERHPLVEKHRHEHRAA